MGKDWITPANSVHQNKRFWTAEGIDLNLGPKIEASEQSALKKIPAAGFENGDTSLSASCADTLSRADAQKVI
uniref:AlNc14C834G12561 protein n=1 Tax=Albugo laibachii Nc14 TaxID=890382 RepID=F0X251_9STRA|nr:AlNc14C834G12561 [Albugo laibachii Nc14]|eukprot:CCA27924.1 AlNc14C834G12561 [Albugo laibachii Nc14]